MKRDSAVEPVGFCGKNVTYEAMKKTCTAVRERSWKFRGQKRNVRASSLVSNYNIKRSPMAP